MFRAGYGAGDGRAAHAGERRWRQGPTNDVDGVREPHGRNRHEGQHVVDASVAADDDLDPAVVRPDRHVDVAIEADRALLRPRRGSRLRVRSASAAGARRSVWTTRLPPPTWPVTISMLVTSIQGAARTRRWPWMGSSVEAASSPGLRAAELELDDRSARDDRVALLDVGDDGERVDGPGVLVHRRAGIDPHHGARVSGPVILDAVRVAAAGRSVAPAEVEERPVVAQDLLDALGPLDVVAVVDLDAVEIDARAKVRSRRLGIEADVVEVADALRQPRVVQLEVPVRVARRARRERWSPWWCA